MSDRSVLEKTYTDKCTVYCIHDEVRRSVSRQQKTTLYQDIPCALSQKHNNPSVQTESEKSVAYTHKLFVSPDLIIYSGCEITVEKYSRKYHFTSVGEPFVYETHQEILLSADKRV